MTKNVDVAALSKLARLEINDAELQKLEEEIPAILSFVETIQKASAGVPKGKPGQRNVMRDDTNPHEGGKYSKALLEAAPVREGDRIAVKQVVKRN